MKRVTTISLSMAIAFFSVVSVMAATSTLDENGFRMIPTKDNAPVCSDDKSWLPEPCKSIGKKNKKSKKQATHNPCFHWDAAGLQDGNQDYIFHRSQECAFWAAKVGNLERFAQNTKDPGRNRKFRWDIVDAQDRTLLLVAASGRSEKAPGHPAVAKKVLANIKKIARSAQDLCAQLAYDAKRYVNYPDKDGKTALWHAVANRNIDMIKILLDNGAEIDLDKLPPDVYWSVSFNKDETVSKKEKDKQKITVLMLAVLKAKRDKTKIVDLLLTAHPDVAKTTDETFTYSDGRIGGQDRIGYTVLHMAAQKGYINIVTSLLNACQDKNACLNARANFIRVDGNDTIKKLEKNGITPWMIATIFKQEEVADYLLRSGAEVTDEDRTLVDEIKVFDRNKLSQLQDALNNKFKSFIK